MARFWASSQSQVHIPNRFEKPEKPEREPPNKQVVNLKELFADRRKRPVGESGALAAAAAEAAQQQEREQAQIAAAKAAAPNYLVELRERREKALVRSVVVRRCCGCAC